ncbi:MAG: tetratricopeptide repeat protein [Chthoniobacterales bacterium]
MKREAQLWRILNDKLETLRACDRIPEAIRVGETALELASRVFPENDPSLGMSYERLGQLYEQQGNHELARPYLTKALCIAEQAPKPEQRVIYRRARRLAYLCDRLGEQEAAIKSYETAIRSGGQLDSFSHTELGTLLNNVALIYRKNGREKAAEPYYLRALELYEKHLGPDHPDVAAVLNNLGVFYTNERRFPEAEQMHRRALAIRTRAHPRGHADIAQSNCNLAVVFHSRGDFKEAGELYRESLGAWENLPGNPPEDYEIVVSNYADLLRSLGKARKAAAIEARARKRRRH